MHTAINDRLLSGCRLMDAFAQRTGLLGTDGNIRRRYLWTDAFAVQNFLQLGQHVDPLYTSLAKRLIEEVHNQLGKFRDDDIRTGWISGQEPAIGRQHPTIGGLRIGKELPERKVSEPYDEKLEWSRDGQYFHYLSRWMHALSDAAQYTGEMNYAEMAGDLLEVSSKFIHTSDGRVRMYWKMSTDLSRPLVSSMGAHDPLEGLVSAYRIMHLVPARSDKILPMINLFKSCSKGMDWSTTDPLGIGGLLINLSVMIELENFIEDIPSQVRPRKLYSDCLYGLEVYRRIHEQHLEAGRRLAFRECGLSAGLRAVQFISSENHTSNLSLQDLERYSFLADEIEAFWRLPLNQQTPSWMLHQDINSVMLASSLVTGEGMLNH